MPDSSTVKGSTQGSMQGPMQGLIQGNTGTLPMMPEAIDGVFSSRKSKKNKKIKKNKNKKKHDPNDYSASLLYGQNGELNPDSQLAYTHDYIPFEMGYANTQGNDNDDGDEYYLVSGPAAYGYNSSEMPPLERHSIFSNYRVSPSTPMNNSTYDGSPYDYRGYGSYHGTGDTEYGAPPPDYSLLDRPRYESDRELNRRQAPMNSRQYQMPTAATAVASQSTPSYSGHRESFLSPAERPRSAAGKPIYSITREKSQEDFLRPSMPERSHSDSDSGSREREHPISRSRSPVVRHSSGNKKPSLFDNSASASPYSFVSLLNKFKESKKEKADRTKKQEYEPKPNSIKPRQGYSASGSSSTLSNDMAAGTSMPRNMRPLLSSKGSNSSLNDRAKTGDPKANYDTQTDASLESSLLWSAVSSASAFVSSWASSQYSATVGDKSLSELVFGFGGAPNEELQHSQQPETEDLSYSRPPSRTGRRKYVNGSAAQTKNVGGFLVDQGTIKAASQTKYKSKLKDTMKTVFATPGRTVAPTAPAVAVARSRSPLMEQQQLQQTETPGPGVPVESEQIPLASHFVNYARNWARLSFILIPVDAIADAFPSLQNFVVIVELVLLMWLLYQVSILIETLATAVKAVCMPIIVICRLFGMYK